MGQANQLPIFDGYANLVQHGAQNTYFAFISELYTKQSAGLLDKDEVEDLVQKLATWDDDIAFFANDGVVYTFDVASDPEPLKRFHQMYNLANCNNIAVSDKWGIWSNNQLEERIRKFAQGVNNQGKKS